MYCAFVGMNNKLYKKIHSTYIKITAILCFGHLTQSIYRNSAYFPSSLPCVLIYSILSSTTYSHSKNV